MQEMNCDYGNEFWLQWKECKRRENGKSDVDKKCLVEARLNKNFSQWWSGGRMGRWLCAFGAGEIAMK